MSDALEVAVWPHERLGEVLDALAVAGGLAPGRARAMLAGAPMSPGALEVWIEQAAAHLGVEAEPLSVAYRELVTVLRTVGPALLRLPGDSSPRFLAVVGRTRRGLLLLCPDRPPARLPVDVIAGAFAGALEAHVAPDIARMLDALRVAAGRRVHVRRVLLRERLGGAYLDGIWVLRAPPGASPARQFAEAGLPRRILTVVAAQVATSALLTLAWWTVAQGVLEDQLDGGWMLAWALLLITAVPVRLIGSWSAGVFAIDAGGLLKRRLLAGALSLEPEEIRHEGAGGFLGRVIESSAVETLALGAGLAGISSMISLVLAIMLLFRGADGLLQVILLLVWTAVSVVLVARYHRRRSRWTDARLTMTNDLVERMGGYRTRLAQELRERWHDGEDQALARYLRESAALDRAFAAISAVLPRGWLVVGVLGLVPVFVAGGASAPSLALSLAGVLLAGSALQGRVGGLTSLSAAGIAWRQVASLFAAAARGEAVPAPRPVAEAGGAATGTLLDAHELVFRHGDRGLPVLRGASLRISRGDRLLLEGPSGGGKSTLSAVLAGLRAPESGLLLLDGLDRRSLGSAAWRRQVANAPQFHENHVLQGSFAFNLLMGRRWPPNGADLAEAEAVCRELGLGALLERMPAGLMQLVGETGWQLSHGERSRLYIARALLQGAQLLLLDESFGALDPETLAMALRCVLARASTVLVIAHP